MHLLFCSQRPLHLRLPQLLPIQLCPLHILTFSTVWTWTCSLSPVVLRELMVRWTPFHLVLPNEFHNLSELRFYYIFLILCLKRPSPCKISYFSKEMHFLGCRYFFVFNYGKNKTRERAVYVEWGVLRCPVFFSWSLRKFFLPTLNW